MRKIIESTLLSLDGVIGDPHAWAGKYFDAQAQQSSLEQLLQSDAMLMGKNTYQIFARVWPQWTGPYADRMNGMRKYVFSSTLEHTTWENSVIVRGDVSSEVARLKQQGGQDLVIYGHGPLGRALLRAGLLDEVHFRIHPVIVGEGRLAFAEFERKELELIKAEALPNGVISARYRPTA
jgi:dihydrofolate reductase